MKQIDFYYKDDLEYSNKRLSNCFVFHKDLSLIYIDRVMSNGEAKNPKLFVVGAKASLDSKMDYDKSFWGVPLSEIPVNELNMAPLELGYCYSSLRRRASFLSRIPFRTAYKQGLCLSFVKIHGGAKNDFSPKDLLYTALGKYPTLQEAFSLATKNVTKVAFSRNFAVEHSGEIEYNGDKFVGKLARTPKGVCTVVLDPKYGFLQQHLDWSLK